MTLRPVVPRPGKIICVGLNYKAHVDEGVYDLPDYPALFPKFADTLLGAGEPVALPPESEAVDYEAELAFVVGRSVRRVSGDEALAAVAGYTIANDVSMRDYQYKSHQWLAGKAWARSTPLGPFLVTPDEVGDPHALDITLELNGERMQDANTRLFIFDIPTIVATITEFTPLHPGDVVLTGTPAGVGYRRDPKVLLRDGDRMVVEIERVGRLENPGRRRVTATVAVTFDNLGEASDLERGWWPEDEPLGAHHSVTKALPRLLEALDEAGLRATFFVEGLNTELYPETLVDLDARGHEVACHGWRHERWAKLDPATERDRLARSVEGMRALGLAPVRLPAAGRRADGGDAGAAARARVHLLLARRRA